jgi:hypothetical protein
MQTTVVTHIWNESFLLPFWLKHHREIFDRGVVIDYHSTDSSREIFEDLAPKNWEWIPSRDTLFYAEGCDAQVMEQERRFPDWKMALNITEFLFEADLHGYLTRFDQEFPHGPAIWTQTFMMVDPVSRRSFPVSPHNPLVLQRWHGLPAPEGWGRERMIHRAEDGRYHPGRHRSDWHAMNRADLLLLWFNYSPFDQIKQRKLQIQRQLPQADIDLGRGHHHILTEEQLEAQYLEVASRTTDLCDYPDYYNASYAYAKHWIDNTLDDTQYPRTTTG